MNSGNIQKTGEKMKNITSEIITSIYGMQGSLVGSAVTKYSENRKTPIFKNTKLPKFKHKRNKKTGY